MSNVGKEILAGLAATIVLSALMTMKSTLGIMPQLDMTKMLAGMLGAPDKPIVGWIAHFMIGVPGYGIAMAMTDRRYGSSAIRAVVLGWTYGRLRHHRRFGVA